VLWQSAERRENGRTRGSFGRAAIIGNDWEMGFVAGGDSAEEAFLADVRVRFFTLEF